MKEFDVKKKLVCLLLIVVGGCMVTESIAPDNLLLSGSDWFIREGVSDRDAADEMYVESMRSTGWIPATVPGNIQSDLETAHLLKPLWYGSGDPRLYEVAQKNWLYRKDFHLSKSFEGKRLKLMFGGVDFECEVWLNGKRLGANSGMFRKFGFDVTDVAKPGHINLLAVKIKKMPDELVDVLIASDGKMSGGVGSDPWANPDFFVNGINRMRQLLKDLKSPTNFGWDWGVNIYTLGIWKDVHLEASGPARTDWIQVQSELSDNYKKATIKTSLEINSLAAINASATFTVKGHGSDINTTIDAPLQKGNNVITAELNVDNPALWWPNGQGDSPLYDLEVRLEESKTGVLLDTRTTRFGIRQVRWGQVEGAPDDFINPYQLFVNGRPVRTMGSNIIPPDLLFGRMNGRGLRLIRLAKSCGINTLRVWGGGALLTEDMYELADELGIMLLQEFPLANCVPESDSVFLANLEETVRNIIKQYRNHPSIIEWSGGNEMMWKQGEDYPALKLLEKVTAENDNRIFRATCPIQGGRHSPWNYEPNTHYAHYDTENFMDLWDEYSLMRYGEFGCQTPANLEVWQREIPISSQWPFEGYEDPILIRKNVIQAVFTKDYWLQKNVVERLFGPQVKLEDLVEAGQFLGAEGLRYAMDALRRRGKTIGGFNSWDYNEPWPNGGGSFLVDYDGRTLMNYDFVKQALALVSLSLKYDSILYDPDKGLDTELWIVSDAPNALDKLRWRWTARDRRGTIIGSNQGNISMDPQQVEKLASIHVDIPLVTVLGPVFIETQLLDVDGIVLSERIHVFGSTMVDGSLGGLLKKGLSDTDDTKLNLQVISRSGPTGTDNIAYVGNGAKPATASSETVWDLHKAKGLNDGKYGNFSSWLSAEPMSFFVIDLQKIATVSQFRLGRDRTGSFEGEKLDYLKVETSTDNKIWHTVFEQKKITALKDYDPTKTMTVNIKPIKTKLVKVTVNSDTSDGKFAAIDEFEVYAPVATAKPGIEFTSIDIDMAPCRPVSQTSLDVLCRTSHIENNVDKIELTVKNVGQMTAIFCEPHPLIEYQTDLFIKNNHISIPPGESRTIEISALAQDGLTLEQTGWRVSCWNANDVIIRPSQDVLLSVGRRDLMCREFKGYGDSIQETDFDLVQLNGTHPEAQPLPLLQKSGAISIFTFSVDPQQATKRARLRIHTADQSRDVTTALEVIINGKRFSRVLPEGLGVQNVSPSHLAFPFTAEYDLPAGTLKAGDNVIKVRVSSNNGGWFTWDSLDLVVKKSG